MKTTKKLNLNKETIAHLSRTEVRTILGGIIIKPTPTTPDAGCAATATCLAVATCPKTCKATCAATCAC